MTGGPWVHRLDLTGPPEMECEDALERIVEIAERLGFTFHGRQSNPREPAPPGR
jgi:hypothetical protein